VAYGSGHRVCSAFVDLLGSRLVSDNHRWEPPDSQERPVVWEDGGREAPSYPIGWGSVPNDRRASRVHAAHPRTLSCGLSRVMEQAPSVPAALGGLLWRHEAVPLLVAHPLDPKRHDLRLPAPRSLAVSSVPAPWWQSADAHPPPSKPWRPGPPPSTACAGRAPRMASSAGLRPTAEPAQSADPRCRCRPCAPSTIRTGSAHRDAALVSGDRLPQLPANPVTSQGTAQPEAL
jgi:hypothetical protein